MAVAAHVPRGPRPRRGVAGLLLAVLLLGAMACSSSDGGSDGGSDPAGDDAASSTTAGDAEIEGPALGDPDGTDPLDPLPEALTLPIVFVHGFAGSAQQYESQAMRFVANGWPEDRISAYEHDGAGFDLEGYTEGLSTFIDEVLAEHGVEQVYLVGHSRGTFVSSTYVGDPARAAKVDRYIAIDGAPCPETEVPCLAVTQATLPGQAHVETATSAESFVQQFQFLVGSEPEVVDIVPQREPVELTGRAVEFPANVGRGGARLEVWAVDDESGQRVGDEPYADFDLGSDGAFGPFEVVTGAHYEWVLSAEDSEVEHHLYLQPYVRSSSFVRLLSSPPDGATRTNTNAGDDHTSLIVMRMREWYATDDADLPGDQADVLEVAVAEDDPTSVLPGFVGNATIGVHLHDDAATPGETTLDPLPYFSEQPFQSGVDVFVRADEDATVTVTNLPRGDADRPQVLRFPAWPSSRHAVSVVFSDWAVD